MNDTALVGILQRLRNLFRVSERCFERQRTRQRFTLNKLHRYCAFFDTVDMSDVGMIERSQNLGLALESGRTPGIAGELFRQYLQRDIALQLRVPRPIDFSHSTRAERREDLIRAEGCAWSQGHWSWILLQQFVECERAVFLHRSLVRMI